MEGWGQSMVDVAENCNNPWTIFLELLKPDSKGSEHNSHWPRLTGPGCDALLNIAPGQVVSYMGHLYLAITTKLNIVLPKLCALASIPTDSTSTLWEERSNSAALERIEGHKQATGAHH